MKTDFEHFLRPTKYCDFRDETIEHVSKEILINDAGLTDAELAKKLFYFVRDSIKYRVGFWNKKASETLSEGFGTCTNKANLLVALLRKSGIPAGYGVMTVMGKEYFGPIVPERLKNKVSSRSKHVYCYLYLHSRWIKCDPSDDRKLAINTEHLNPQSSIVEWDGASDSMLQLSKEHIIDDLGPLHDIDYLIEKKMRRKLVLPVLIGNSYIEFIRENGKQYNDTHSIENDFLLWLKTRNIFLFFVFKYLLVKPSFSLPKIA